MSESDTTPVGAQALDSDPVEEHGALVEVGDIAADFIEALLDIADLDGDIEIDQAHGRSTVTVTTVPGGNLRVLADPETVSALQDLTRLAVQAKTGEPARLLLDIGGSRDARSKELADLVAEARNRIEAGAESVSLAPMSSYERKLVHDLVSDSGLTSHSEGEGVHRHTVVTA